MAGDNNVELGPLPEGLNILKNDRSGELFVINEVLNFYQRKLAVIDKAAAFNLAHNQFEQKELEQAKELLKKLWEWKKLSPSTSNDYIIKNLSARRLNRGNKHVKLTLAKDIINFFDVEDRKLNVRFLTLKCEKIPSKVHESAAMQDVYVLLHKSQEDYNTVIDGLMHRDDTIISQGRTVEALKEDVKAVREEMKKGFLVLSNLLRKHASSSVSTVSPIDQVDLTNNITTSTNVENEINETSISVNSSSDDAVPQITLSTEESEVVEDGEEVTVTHRVEMPGSGSELEEGECSDSDSEDPNYSIISDTYNETLDIGNRAPITLAQLISSTRHEQHQQSRASELSRTRPATRAPSPLPRVRNEQPDRNPPGQNNYRGGNEQKKNSVFEKKAKKKCNFR